MFKTANAFSTFAGLQLEGQSLHQEALMAFSFALSINDYVPQVYMAGILRNLGGNSLSIARTFLRNALRLEPTSHRAWLDPWTCPEIWRITARGCGLLPGSIRAPRIVTDSGLLRAASHHAALGTHTKRSVFRVEIASSFVVFSLYRSQGLQEACDFLNVYGFGFARVASLSVLRWTSLTILFALGNSKIMCISCVCTAIGGTTTKCMTRELGEMLDPRIMLKVQVLSGLASGTCKAPNSMLVIHQDPGPFLKKSNLIPSNLIWQNRSRSTKNIFYSAN